MNARVPAMPGPPPDYRDDYVKAQLARAVYADKASLIGETLAREVPEGAVLPSGWSLLGDDRREDNFRNDTKTGFVAAAFEGPDGRIVIAFRGTDDGEIDWSLGLGRYPVGPNPVLAADSDVAKEAGVPVKTGKTAGQLAEAQAWVAHHMGMPDWNRQFTQALDYVADIQRSYPDRKIEVTGHSLGGALAELASYTYGLDGRAFDPPGAKNLLDSDTYLKYCKNHGIERNDTARALGLPMHAPDFTNYLVNDSLVSHKSGPHIYEDRTQPISALAGRHGVDEHVQWAIGKAGALASEAVDLLPPGLATMSGLKPTVTGLRAAHAMQEGELLYKAMAESDTLGRHAMDRITEVFKEAAESGTLRTFGQIDAQPAPQAPAQRPTDLRDQAHPGHAQYRQTLHAVHMMEAMHRIAPGSNSEKVAAALMVEGERAGQSIDKVELGSAGRVQGVQMGFGHAPDRQVTIDANQALAQPMDALSHEWARLRSPHLVSDAPAAVRTREQAEALDRLSPQDQALFARIRSDVPAHIGDDKVAQVMLAAKQAGMDRADKVEVVCLRDENVFVKGTLHCPVGLAKLDLSERAPPIQATVQASADFDQQQLQQRAQWQEQQQQVSHHVGGRTRS